MSDASTSRRLRTLRCHLAAPAASPAASAGEATAGDEGRAFSALAKGIEADLASHSIPSLAVAVARGGTIIWEAGFGWADREGRRPATAHTPYSLASISKPITATALAILAERGAVDLDAQVPTQPIPC